MSSHCFRNSTFKRIVFIISMVVLFASTPAQNPIVTENLLTGDPSWEIPNNINANAANHEIEGYVTSVSVKSGDPITYCVRTPYNYTVNVYRMGWYGGTGARNVYQVAIQAPRIQPSATTDAFSGLIECNWTPEAPISTQGWLSGVYLIKLTTLWKTPKSCQLIVVVRDDIRSTDFLFQTNPTTYQAYNNWGEIGTDGMSLYGYKNLSAVSINSAVTVSFDRPYASDIYTAPAFNGQRTADQSLRRFLKEEYPMLRYMEKNGNDVSYTTDLDVGLNQNTLLNHKAILIIGHGEYWNMATRTNLEYARDHYVNLAFLCGNTGYWQVRYGPNAQPTPIPNRRITSWKESALYGNSTGVVPEANNPDPFKISMPLLTTTKFRDPIVNKPENALIGVMFDDSLGSDGFELPMVLNSAAISAGTPLLEGVIFTTPTYTTTTTWNGAGMLGFEVDAFVAPSTGKTSCIQTLSSSPWNATQPTRNGIAHSTIYRPPNNSGGTVFAAGTILWSWALDDFGSSRAMGNSTASYKDTVIIGITNNLLQWFRKTPSAPTSKACFMPSFTRADLVAEESASGNWDVALSTGTNFLAQPSPWLSAWKTPGSSYNFMAGDFNGDGKMDALAQQVGIPGNWSVALNNGAAFLPTASSWLIGWPTSSTAFNVLIGDVNGDGMADLITKESVGSWYVALSNGSSFTYQPSWLSGWAITSSAYNLLTGDFNGDGKTDILAKEQTTGTWYVALSNGSSFVAQPSSWITGFAINSSLYNLMVADVNGDGRDDLIAKETNTGTWHVALSTGTSFINQPNWLTGWANVSSAYNLLVGDFNRDGKADLLAKEQTTGTWYVALSNGAQFVPQPFPWLTGWCINSSLFNIFDGDCDGQ